MWIESRVGVVSTFSLPSHAHHNQNLARCHSRCGKKEKSSMRKRILVAEDDPGLGEMLHEMLSDAGYEVEIQSDGHAVQHMAEPLPDLLFLDIRLSGTDGRTICRQLKSQEATHRLPIIMLSALKDTRQLAREAGADDFLAKPFEMADLLALAAK
jgi:DNA-binding response OmpR family regulator